MIPGKTYTLEDFLWMGWQRKWLILVPFVLVTAGTLLWSHLLPNQYRSETVILVVPQRVPDTYVHSTVTSPIEDRLQSISPEILSGTRLERIIRDLDLYVEQREKLTMEEVLEYMRKNIKVETIKGDAFRVSYSSSDPVKAMEVTKRLASMFIDENLRDREALAEGTNQFLESQLNDARARLVEQEKNLEEFRRRHAGELPSQVTPNLQSIQNNQMRLQALGESISRNRDRVTMLEGLVDAALSGDTDQAPVPSAPSTSADPLLAGASSAADRLEAARKSLRELQTRLTDNHPTVRRLERVIGDLERAVENEARQRQQADLRLSRPLTTAEVAKRDRVREMQAEIKSLKQRIVHEEAEQQRVMGAIAAYQQRIEVAPARESELAELTRDYQTLQNVYASLLTRREDSKMAADLERRQVGEQFRILDPPRLPEKPFSPNRILLNAIGALLGLGLGVALAGLREYRDTSLHTEADVVTTLAIPVLALIPAMVTDAERRSRRRRRLFYYGAAAAALLMSAALTMAAWKSGILHLIG
jgi:polysaccharide chain length determinant protein (PEP-CTERM system associated)